MAIVKNSLLLRGISGRLGELVFRQCRNKTVVAIRPRTNKNRVVSTREQAVREKFKSCSKYAQQAMADPGLRATYEARRSKTKSPRGTAFLDAFHGPEIASILTTDYSGSIGSRS